MKNIIDILVSLLVALAFGLATLLILGLFSKSVKAKPTTNCTRNPSYCQILKADPSIDKDYAMKISNIIHKYSKEYNIPKDIYTAILAQESMYTIEIVRCGNKSNINTCDYGISQIWYITAHKLNLDVDKLTADLDYSIKAGATVLAGLKVYKKREKYWWTRYNSSKPRIRNRYRKLVERYL